VSVDLHSLVPLRPAGRRLLLAALLVLAVGVSGRVAESHRRLTGVMAAMTTLLMIALWVEHRIPDRPTSAADSSRDEAALLREREADIGRRTGRGGTRDDPALHLIPVRRLLAGTVVPLPDPLDGVALYLDRHRGHLTARGDADLFQPAAEAGPAAPCAAPDASPAAIRMATIRVGTVLCIRTATHDGTLVVTARSGADAVGVWLEFVTRVNSSPGYR
jgi:hypothetical protein